MSRSLSLLRILKSNLQKMQTLLSYGDGESAVKITFQNERIIALLDSCKNAQATDELKIQELVEDCLLLQEDCDSKLKSIALEYKKELNIHLIKNQLHRHLKNT